MIDVCIARTAEWEKPDVESNPTENDDVLYRS